MKKKVFYAVYTLCFMQMLALAAHAYIDVSSTTYIVQIVAGIVVVLSTVAGVVISSVKKKLKEKVGIDLDKKEDEEELVVYEDDKENKQ